MERARDPEGTITPRCLVDPAITRPRAGEFQFPLGVYPVEPFTPIPGYVSEFERADGGGGGDGFGERWGDDFEEWPDRYVFDIVVSVERLPTLVALLLSMMPGRVYPIFDVIGFDAYREIDPYMSYELVGIERVIDAIRELRPFLFEDGMAGFGAMCEDPFMYLFVDEHKILTLRVEPDQRDRVQALLKAFDLEPVERLEGVDAANHEHRTVLLHPADRPEALSPEEIIEYLRENWRLRLNIDPEENVDDEGKPLGVTAWRCVVRCASETQPTPRYAEVVLRADCLLNAEEQAMEIAGTLFADDVRKPRRPRGMDRSPAGGPTGGPTRGPTRGPTVGATGDRPERGPTGANPDIGPGDPTEADEIELDGWMDTIVVSADRLTPELQRELLAETGWISTPPPGEDVLGPAGSPTGKAPREIRGDDSEGQGIVAVRWMD